MPFVSQAVAVKSSIENHQKTRENEVKQNTIGVQEEFQIAD